LKTFPHIVPSFWKPVLQASCKIIYGSEKAPVCPMQHRDAKTAKDRPLQKLENTAGLKPGLYKPNPEETAKPRRKAPASEGGR
jgi:hypothetical protein